MSEKQGDPPKLDYASPEADQDDFWGVRDVENERDRARSSSVKNLPRHSLRWIATEAGTFLVAAVAASLYFQSLLVLYVGLTMAGFSAAIQFVVNRWGDVPVWGRSRRG